MMDLLRVGRLKIMRSQKAKNKLVRFICRKQDIKWLTEDEIIALPSREAGEDIILVADRTTPNDIGSIAASRGVLTGEGGMTSQTQDKGISP